MKKTDIIDLSWGTSFFSAKSPGPMKFLNPTVTVERNMEQKSDLSRCCGGSDRHRRDREWKDHADHPVYGRGWEYLVSDSVSVCENCQVKEMFAQQYFKCFHWLASFCLGRVSRNLRFQNPAGLKQNLAMKSWNNWHHDTFQMGLDEAGYTSRGVIGCTQPRRVAVLLA